MKKFIFFLVIILFLIFPILLIIFGAVNFSSLKSSTINSVIYSDDNYQYNFTENVDKKLDEYLELKKFDGYSLKKLIKKLGKPSYLISYQPISNNTDSKTLDIAIYSYNLKDSTASYFYFIDGEFHKSKNDEFNGIDTKNLDSSLNYQLENFK